MGPKTNRFRVITILSTYVNMRDLWIQKRTIDDLH